MLKGIERNGKITVLVGAKRVTRAKRMIDGKITIKLNKELRAVEIIDFKTFNSLRITLLSKIRSEAGKKSAEARKGGKMEIKDTGAVKNSDKILTEIRISNLIWETLHRMHSSKFFNLSAITYLKKDRIICRLEKSSDYEELSEVEKSYLGKSLIILVKHGETGTKYINEIDLELDKKLEGMILNRERWRRFFDKFLELYKGENQDPTFNIDDYGTLKNGKHWEIKKILNKEYDI